ncbi:facilitated trehalose transporter Tret1-like [Osmia bicornis bicornis]|uniref:facilitated trehalose transporter Tret1-like n=1 Tax=Osmia bicornis bicornis TaxID=1437191 RepID=UPI001EAF23E3|nr:facilitated trehalose transporter Tret1-like [Osmia bicornis bicornis]
MFHSLDAEIRVYLQENSNRKIPFVTPAASKTLKMIDTLIGVWPQWIACMTVTLLSITFGMVIGWTSPYLAQLTSEEGLFFVTEEEASWVASLMPFGRMIGSIVGAIIMEYHGSKMALFSAGLPNIVGWICIIFANSAGWLYVSRIFAGISIGIFFCCFPLYIGEIAAAKIRGALVSVIMNGMPIGTLLGNVMGTQMSIMWFGIISLILNMCYVMIFPALPHTPYYYVHRDNIEEAKKTIQWYHRRSIIGVELEVIGSYVRGANAMNLREKLEQMREKKNKRVFGIVLLLFIIMQLSGYTTVIFYMEIITTKAKVTLIAPQNVVIIAGALGIIFGWISVILIDRSGRRILVAMSCCGVITAMVLLILHFTLVDLEHDPKSSEWTTILAMMFFMTLALGLVPVPNTLLSELFPPDLRSIAGFIASFTSALFAFISSITFYPMVTAFTEKSVFICYALVMIGGLAFSLTCVPETKGKTLQEIQEMMDNRYRQGQETETAYQSFHTISGVNMTAEGGEKLTRRVTWPQWIAGIEVLLLVTQVGSIGAWSSPYIGQLTSTESEPVLTMTEVSWVVSLMNVGRLFGAIFGALCANYLGSKTTVLITSIPVAFCWLFMILADSVEWLYAARISGGASLGMIYSCFSLYLAEIADPKIRGALVTVGMTGLPFGNLIICIMGAYLPLKTSAAIALGPCVVLMVFLFLLPESPHHLIKKHMDEKAKASIRWYHRDCDVESEFNNLQKFLHLRDQSLLDTLKELKAPHFRKSILIVSVLFIYSQLSGINNVLLYMESILTSAKVSVLGPAQVVIIVMCFGNIGSFLSSFLIDRFGRRVLLIVSCVGVAISMCMLSLEFQLLNFGFQPETVEGVSISAMLFFYISAFGGIIPVPATILSEIFPSHLKCYAACITSCTSAIFGFISTSTYLPLLHLMTERYVFFFYGFCLLTAIPFTLFCVPETKGLTLQEIQSQLTDKK